MKFLLLLFSSYLLTVSITAKNICFNSTLPDNKAKTKAGKKRYNLAKKLDKNMRCIKNLKNDDAAQTFAWYGTGFFYVDLDCKENLVLELIIPKYEDDLVIIDPTDKALIKKIKDLGFKELRILEFFKIELPDKILNNYEYIYPLFREDWATPLTSSDPRLSKYKRFSCSK